MSRARHHEYDMILCLISQYLLTELCTIDTNADMGYHLEQNSGPDSFHNV